MRYYLQQSLQHELQLQQVAHILQVQQHQVQLQVVAVVDRPLHRLAVDLALVADIND